MEPRDDYALVANVLDEVVEGPRAAARDLARSLVTLVRDPSVTPADALAAVQERLAARDLGELLELIRYLSVRFHLLNNAEKANIARINREREQGETYERPRAESIAEALRLGAEAGLDAAHAVELVSGLDVQPTLTAHPTEARRRSLQFKLQEVSALLQDRHAADATPAERRRMESRLRQVTVMLAVTDDVRSRRLGVLDEVRNGVHYLTGAIWETVPLIARDLVDGLRGVYGDGAAVMSVADLSPLLRYRTWMGGDRDGNPRVTSAVTRETLGLLGAAAREKLDAALDDLRRELSVSDSRCDVPPRLRAAIERDAAFASDDPGALAHAVHEPFRLRLMQLRARLRDDPDYTGRALRTDLEELRDCLRECGLPCAADEGPLAELILRVRVFGLHLAALDIRQHAGVHERVVDEMLRLGGVHAGYASLGEDDRLEILRRELDSPRPLLPAGARVSEETHEVLDVLRVVAEAQAREPDAVQSYVISMTTSVSDVLEVLLLMKETGLFQTAAEGEGSAVCSGLDVVPLLETIDDLERGPTLLGALFAEPIYRAQMEARGAIESADGAPFQEIMLGYSDSNKDGGFLMANVALHTAQRRIGETCRAHGVAFRLFHGRGGTVGRGGGRANRAILSMPAAAHNGRIRVTEQGEVISFRYGVPAIARRHLEQIVSAMMASARIGRAAPTPEASGAADDASDLADRLARRSMEAYRALIDDPAFWPWFASVSPVSHVGGLPIASRPVTRSSGDLTFGALRAIPWVFSWIQMRYLAPSWYGLGAALGEMTDDDLARARAAYEGWTFFRTLVDNAQREMARARLETARLYALEHEHGERMHGRLERDFEAARTAILSITGHATLLEGEPVIARAIDARNPWTDLLNLVQIELLRRMRAERDPAARERLEPVIVMSINAIAAAMQSTG